MDLKSLYKDVEEIKPHVLKHRVPLSIFKEIEKCVKHTDKIRKHKLSYLVEHYNVGHNAYQVSVPFNLLEGSFLQAYILYLGEFYRCKYENLSFEDTRRTVRMRKNENHFDGYDLWVNYAEKGSVNILHNHSGFLSGVIYYTDCRDSPIYFEDGFSYRARKGDVIIFPSLMRHGVRKHENKKTRITLAYNLRTFKNAYDR
tara:strand:+ start:98 stop:697 length:600 start_codon:yes stop_codon:yes gene_type:complete